MQHIFFSVEHGRNILNSVERGRKVTIAGRDGQEIKEHIDPLRMKMKTRMNNILQKNFGLNHQIL